MSGRPHIVLGVSGGIAAYKAAELIRLLVRDGLDVRVVMTAAATRFITPLTLQTLSGHEVLLHLFEPEASRLESYAPEDASPAARPAGVDQSGIEHIDIVKNADLVVVAPATANVLARAAHGLADDALSTVLLAAGPRVLFAPAMNHRMWHHPATQASLALLKSRGATIIEPGVGYQACGETGIGRMAEPAEIHAAIQKRLFRRRDLEGRRVIVTAGRTEEPVDPVRVLTNRSSGRMGAALAEEARDRGAEVTLVAGVLSVEPPAGVEVVSAPTAREMEEAVLTRFPKAEVLVMAAAVADFRPARPAAGKIRRASGMKAIDLEPTTDIVQTAARGRRAGQVVVGFALETDGGRAAAAAKLVEKKLDFVVLNNPTTPGSEFGGPTNQVTLLGPKEEIEELPLQTKREVAAAVFDRVVKLLGKGEDRVKGRTA